MYNASNKQDWDNLMFDEQLASRDSKLLERQVEVKAKIGNRILACNPNTGSGYLPAYNDVEAKFPTCDQPSAFLSKVNLL